MRGLIVVCVIAVAMPAVVHAQPADVPALIKLIENQPNDMDRSTWKEKRRDAARKLGQSKDKRAVPVLINLADSETFDIIGDIAIEGLGNLKEQAAVPTLQRIVNDASRDKSSRDLAHKALQKLGAPDTAPAGGGTGSATPTGGGAKTGTGTGSAGATTGGTTGTTTGGATGTVTGGGTVAGGTTGTTGGAKTGSGSTTVKTGTGGAKTGGGAAGTGGGTVTGGGAVGTGGESGGGEVSTGLEGGGTVSGGGGESGGGLIGAKSTTDVEGQPDLGDEVIAAYDRLTFVAGTSSLSYDTVRSRLDFDANAAGLYQKRVDTEKMAYGFDVGADFLAGIINPSGRGATRAVELNVHGDGEGRFYAGKVYGIGKVAVGTGVQQLSYRDATDPGQDVVGSDGRIFTADVQIAAGAGYGRIVDVGALIRVRRLSRMLDNARALGKPIDAATAKKLQLTWWALRGERSSFRSLIATIAILREAGILLGEPNAVITYEILQVLRDSQLYQRPSGFDAQLVVSEGYLHRTDADSNDNCDGLDETRCGRYEQVVATAGYGSQLDDDKLEISGNAYARYRLFPPNSGPAPWAAGATARMRRFTYGEHGEPFGALDLRGTLMVSYDDNMMSDKSARIEGELGFTYLLNQASGVRLSAQVAEDAGELFFLAHLEATYGLLDGIFAR